MNTKIYWSNLLNATLSASFIFSLSVAHCQGKVRIGVNVGQATFDNFDPGWAAAVEPIYSFSRVLDIGIRLESCSTIKVDNASSKFTGVQSITSFANVNLVNSNNLIVFIGAGFGAFKTKKLGISWGSEGNFATTSSVSSGKDIGYYPRLGAVVGRITVMMEYNIGATTVIKTSYDYNHDRVSDLDLYHEAANNYLGFKIGYVFRL